MKTQIVELPFLYNAQIIPYRARRPVPHIVRSKVLVQIPSLTADEAPLGVEWIQNDSFRRYDRADRDKVLPKGPHRIVSRFHDGRHFGAVTKGGDGLLSVEEFVRDAAIPRPARVWLGSRDDGSPSWSTRDFPVPPGIRKGSYGYRDLSAFHFGTIQEALQGGRIHGHNEEEMKADAADYLAKNLIFVDGAVWTTSLAAEMWYGVRDFPGKPPEVFVGYRQDISHWMVPFRADRRDDAIAYAEQIAAKSGVAASITDDEVIIHSPHSIVRDDAIMLASAILVRSGDNIINGREGWPDDVASAHQQLKHAARVDPGARNRHWAAQVFANAELIHEHADTISGTSLGQAVTTGIASTVEHWLASEKARNPDLVDMIAAIKDDEMALSSHHLSL